MFTLSVVAVIYTSLVALAQEDMKKLIAYSSVAHMGVVTIGIFTFNVQGIQGALFQMLSHGIVSGALFLCVGVVYDRIHTREIARYGGLADRMPLYALMFMLFTLASMRPAGHLGLRRRVPGHRRRAAGELLAGAARRHRHDPRRGLHAVPVSPRHLRPPHASDDLRAILDLSPREIAVFAPLIAADAVDGHLPVELHRLLGCDGGGDGAAPSPRHCTAVTPT